MLWPASVPRNSAGVTRESGLQQRATFIIVASAIAAVVVVLAAVLLLLLCRLRARRQQDTPEQKVLPVLSPHLCSMPCSSMEVFALFAG